MTRNSVIISRTIRIIMVVAYNIPDIFFIVVLIVENGNRVVYRIPDFTDMIVYITSCLPHFWLTYLVVYQFTDDSASDALVVLHHNLLIS